MLFISSLTSNHRRFRFPQPTARRVRLRFPFHALELRRLSLRLRRDIRPVTRHAPASTSSRPASHAEKPPRFSALPSSQCHWLFLESACLCLPVPPPAGYFPCHR